MVDMDERMFRARPMSAILNDAFSETVSEFHDKETGKTVLPLRIEFAHDLREKITDAVVNYNQFAPAHEQLDVPHELPWYLIARTILEYYTIIIDHDLTIEAKVTSADANNITGKHSYEEGIKCIHILAREFDPMLTAQDMDSLVMFIYDAC